MAKENLEKMLKPIMEKVKKSGGLTVELSNHSGKLTESEIKRYVEKNNLVGMIRYDPQNKVYHIHIYQR